MPISELNEFKYKFGSANWMRRVLSIELWIEPASNLKIEAAITAAHIYLKYIYSLHLHTHPDKSQQYLECHKNNENTTLASGSSNYFVRASVIAASISNFEVRLSTGNWKKKWQVLLTS